MRARAAARGTSLLCALLLALLLGAPSAGASRALLDEHAVDGSLTPEEQIEGACGVTIFGGSFYVSDYYHHAIDVFGSGTQILAQGLEPENGPCGLGFDASGNLYVNFWHQSVVKSAPPYSYGARQTVDSNESTGVAVDRASGDVYVNDRTSVALYEAPVVAGEPPAQVIGLGSLGDAYGVAIFAGRVYVPDAADDTVKVYEPAVDPLDPVLVIDGADTPQGGFNSLVDAAVAVDPTNGHLVVLDNLQPGFEHPEAALEEFAPSGVYLGRACHTVVDGEPSGLTFNGANLYVTSGNDEEADVFFFGPYASSCPPPAKALAAEAPAPEQAAAAAVAFAGVLAPAADRQASRHRRHRHPKRRTKPPHRRFPAKVPGERLR